MAKRVLVTGAGRGLGEAIVRVLCDRGWSVWATDADESSLATSKAERTLPLDVRETGSVAAAFALMADEGSVDALVNNAGVFPLRPWDEDDAESWHKVLDVNLVGSFLCAQAAAREMIAQGHGGAIVNITSMTFFTGIPTGSAYAASKGGIIGLTRSLACALGPHEIRVNAVGPGLMATEGVKDLVDSGAFPPDRLSGRDEERQLAGTTEPERVAAVVAFLLGEDSAEITGQVIAADGGARFI